VKKDASTNEGQIEFQKIVNEGGRLGKAVIEATNFNSALDGCGR
jgi:hypothetical protein